MSGASDCVLSKDHASEMADPFLLGGAPCGMGRDAKHDDPTTADLCPDVLVYIVMAYMVMAYKLMAYMVMAYIVMVDLSPDVLVYIVMTYIVMAYIVMAYEVMAYMVMAYIVMAGLCPDVSVYKLPTVAIYIRYLPRYSAPTASFLIRAFFVHIWWLCTCDINSCCAYLLVCAHCTNHMCAHARRLVCVAD